MRICVAQARPVKGNITANIEGHKRLIALAVSQGADMVIFPELSLTGYEPERAGKLATTPEDPRLDTFRKLADSRRVVIGAGLPVETGNAVSNGMILFQRNEEPKVYAKKYLHADEEPYFVSGESAVGLIGGKAKIALAICYELSVPEHAENAAKIGAKVYLASVAKTIDQVPRAHERLSEIARHYSMTVLMANCAGRIEGIPAGGRSAIWNTDGALMGMLGETHEGVLLLDTETREVLRKVMPSLVRRPARP